jgi:hypothetical protein
VALRGWWSGLLAVVVLSLFRWGAFVRALVL